VKARWGKLCSKYMKVDRNMSRRDWLWVSLRSKTRKQTWWLRTF
jgi:hypothetical protein